MRRLALAAALLAVLVLALAGRVASRAATPTPTPEPAVSPSPSASPSPSPEPAPELLPPAPSPTPFDPNPAPAAPSIDPSYPGPLRPGDWVQITGTGDCLNMRWEPRIPTSAPDGNNYDNVLNCLPDGFVGRIDGSSSGGYATLPVLGDGRWWWPVIGQGWGADEWLTLHHQGGIPWPERPDLANAGLIALIANDNSISLMNADGSDRRQLVASSSPNAYVDTPRWSPAGDRIAFTVRRWDGSEIATRVIDLSGNTLLEVAGLSDPRWSPSGGRLSGVRVNPAGAGGYLATPVVFDLASGAEWAVGPATHGYQAPSWSPDGNSLAFVCISGYLGQPDGTVAIDETRNCHGDGLRVVSVDGSNARVLIATAPQTGGYISGPAWSPSGHAIAVASMQPGDGCRGYAVVDVASGNVSDCVSPVDMQFSGGGCGGPAMSDPSWTGSRLVYFAPGAAKTGVFVHDLADGLQSFVPTMNAGPPSAAPDGANLTFDGSGYIWLAGLDGANLTLLSEGHSPAWQPLP